MKRLIEQRQTQDALPNQNLYIPRSVRIYDLAQRIPGAEHSSSIRKDLAQVSLVNLISVATYKDARFFRSVVHTWDKLQHMPQLHNTTDLGKIGTVYQRSAKMARRVPRIALLLPSEIADFTMKPNPTPEDEGIFSDTITSLVRNDHIVFGLHLHDEEADPIWIGREKGVQGLKILTLLIESRLRLKKATETLEKYHSVITQDLDNPIEQAVFQMGFHGAPTNKSELPAGVADVHKYWRAYEEVTKKLKARRQEAMQALEF